jgi:uncharacterized protein
MPNRLADETSPYLRQHADNPVDWYPWGEEALARAGREDRPILLSIGYAACHWCHVMAHESFEDPATAAVMNALFVNVKVDREERPDLDRIYQNAQQMLTGRGGGWPLTMFLTPEQVPFFGGTYFPPTPRHGLPAFKDLLERVAAFYRERKADIAEQNVRLLDALAENEALDAPGERLEAAPIAAALAALREHYDAAHGGFGGAPKFPHPPNLERCLRAAALHGDARAREMALHTLTRMARGGLYDQLGGGFARYSVDARWEIPHFEKMLYDNAQLLPLYADAARLTGTDAFDALLRESADWVAREMQDPRGGYYATLDADSEGEEGKYYVWTPDEVRALLTPEEYAVAAPRWGLDRPSNFEGHAWHLQAAREVAEIATALGIAPEAAAARLSTARTKLLAARERRVRPARDEKILTAWNGLMLGAMAKVGAHLGEPRYVDSAQRALDFLRAELWQDGRLHATWKDGCARLTAYLDDYADLAWGVLELLAVRFRAQDLAFTQALMDTALAHYWDDAAGGFFLTADDHEALIVRTRPLADDAMPAGNGVAARVLIRLGHLLGEARYLEAAERTLRAAWPRIVQMPIAHLTLIAALEEHLRAPTTVVLRGEEAALAPWRAVLDRDHAPDRLVLAIPPHVRDLPGVLGAAAPRGAAVAYVCRGTTCGPPVTTPEALRAALAGR